MRTRSIYVCAVGVISVLSSCGLWPSEYDVPLYCDETTACAYDDYPTKTYCDLDGSIEGTGHSCIEPPGGVCTGDTDCVRGELPICELTTQECRSCADGAAGDAECAAKDGSKPVCVAGRCGDCRDSSECAVASPICDSTDQTCRTCTEDAAGDADCAARDSGTPVCIGGTCGECEMSSECAATSPICDTAQNSCGACMDNAAGDAACTARDAATPLCSASGGCVQCEVSGDCASATPVCEPVAGVCRVCRANDECSSEVCADSGACVDPGDIVYVDGSVGSDGASCGTLASPCATIAGPQGGLSKVTAGRNAVRVRSGVYIESVTVDAAQTVRFIGPATVSPPLNLPGLFVRNSSDVTVEQMTMSNASGGGDADGVRCENSGTSVRLLNSTVSSNAATGVQATDCTVTIEQSTVSGNQGGGVSLSSSAFTIRNNFITSNGNAGATNFGGLKIDNSGALAPQVLEFNTIARNQALAGALSSGVDCFATTPIVGASSIVYGGIGGAPAVRSLNCTWTYSDIEGGQAGMGNLDTDPLFVDALNGDFHLKTTSPARNVADPAATLAVDVDDDPRPQGTRRDMGADEVVE